MRKLILEKIKSIKGNNKNTTLSQKYEKILHSHINYIELLSLCSRDNTFSVLNCRKLGKIEDFVNFLKSNEIPYIIKPSYLELFLTIFYKDVDKNSQFFRLNYLIDLFKNCILNELSIFYFHILYFLDNPNEKYKKRDFNNIKNTNEYISKVADINKHIINMITQNPN